MQAGTWSSTGLSVSSEDASRSDMRYMLEMKTDNPEGVLDADQRRKGHPPGQCASNLGAWME